jgi:hypothetical protein
MKSADFLVRKFRRYPFWSQLLLRGASLVLLVAIRYLLHAWRSLGRNGMPRTAFWRWSLTPEGFGLPQASRIAKSSIP